MAASTMDVSEFVKMPGWASFSGWVAENPAALLEARVRNRTIESAWASLLMTRALRGMTPPEYRHLLQLLSSLPAPDPCTISPAGTAIASMSTRATGASLPSTHSPAAQASYSHDVLSVRGSRTVSIRNAGVVGAQPVPELKKKGGAEQVISTWLQNTHAKGCCACLGGFFCCSAAAAHMWEKLEGAQKSMFGASRGDYITRWMHCGHVARVVPNPKGHLRALVITSEGLEHIPCSESSDGTMMPVYPLLTNHAELASFVTGCPEFAPPMKHSNGTVYTIQTKAGVVVVDVSTGETAVTPLIATFPVTTPYGSLIPPTLGVPQLHHEVSTFPTTFPNPPRLKDIRGGDADHCMLRRVTGGHTLPEKWSAAAKDPSNLF